MKPIFEGCGTALVTPFKKDGEIDLECFIKLLEFQIENGVDALIIAGTTGEGSTLTVEEKLFLFDCAVKTVNKRVPVIAGTGSNSTSFALKLAKEAERLDIDAHLIVTPYYNKASQNGILEHYFTLADNLSKPVIVYNVPTRTGVNITPETYFELSKHPNIIAVKEADTNISKIIKAMSLCGDNLHFYMGNDDMITVGASLGSKGVISVLSDIAPRFTAEMIKLALKGNLKEASDMQKKSIELIGALFSDVNPIPVKTVMNHLGLCSDKMRLPLSSMAQNEKAKLIETIEKYREYIY